MRLKSLHVVMFIITISLFYYIYSLFTEHQKNTNLILNNFNYYSESIYNSLEAELKADSALFEHLVIDNSKLIDSFKNRDIDTFEALLFRAYKTLSNYSLESIISLDFYDSKGEKFFSKNSILKNRLIPKKIIDKKFGFDFTDKGLVYFVDIPILEDKYLGYFSIGFDFIKLLKSRHDYFVDSTALFIVKSYLDKLNINSEVKELENYYLYLDDKKLFQNLKNVSMFDSHIFEKYNIEGRTLSIFIKDIYSIDGVLIAKFFNINDITDYSDKFIKFILYLLVTFLASLLLVNSILKFSFSSILSKLESKDFKLNKKDEELKKLTTALEQIADNVMITKTDGEIEYVNRAFCKFTGFSLDESIGKTPTILASNIHPREFFEDMWKIILSGKVYRGIVVNCRKNGEIYSEEKTISPIKDEKGALKYFISTGKDVTKERDALKFLEEERSLFERGPVVVFKWRAVDGWPVEYVSDSIKQFGYSGEDFVKSRVKYLDFIYGADLERVSKEVEQYSSNGFDEFEQDYRVVHKNGDVRWIFDHTNIIKDSNSNIIYYIGYIIDITERKKSQAEIENLNKNLEIRVQEELDKNIEKDRILIQQSKFAQMGEMIGNIAHQWRQPLNTLGLIVQKFEYAYLRGKLDEQLVDNSTTKAMNLIYKMSNTIDDFRNFFQPNKERVVFNLKEIILDTNSLIDASLKNNSIDFDISIKSDISIKGFPSEFSQVLLNLINNSKDALLSSSVENKKIFLKVFRDKNSVFIEILDNAKGIDKSIIDKVFEPYFTTKETGEATGIGLYMSKMIIEKSMKGKIEVENFYENGEVFGAKFTITLNLI